MPVYNDKTFLAKALNSLLAQSWTNFELIISDDGSTDGSEQICRSYSNMDPRITYIRQEKNLGISRNMEFLLSRAKGKYFMWAANDDLWHPNFISFLVELLEKNSKAVSAFCSMYFIGEDDNKLDYPSGRSTDYSGNTPSIRLKKLISIFDDSFGYGLFRRDSIMGVKFPVWLWPNKYCPYNNIYPSLCYYLAKGDFVLNKKKLWYNRLKDEGNINHKIPYNNTFIRASISLSLRKINLVLFSLWQIWRANYSLKLVLQITPRMIFSWFVIPSISEFKNRYRKARNNQLSLL